MRLVLGAPFFGVQDDIWSKSSCRQSFGAMRFSLVIDGKVLDNTLRMLRAEMDQENRNVEIEYKLGAPSSRPVEASYSGSIIECSPVAAFKPLPSSRHTGNILARWNKATLHELGCEINDISLATEDGASNNKKSNRILELESMVCFPHDMQRAVLIASGVDGKPCRNQEFSDFQKKSSKMVSSFSRSGVANADFFESQRDGGEKELALASPNHTRWLGMLKQAERNRLKQPHINVALCGNRAGEASDDDASQSLDDSEDEDELSSQGAGSNCSGDEDEELSADSDDDRLERAARNCNDDRLERAARNCKAYPLKHRLLSKAEFKINAQVESVLSHPGETSALLQTHAGIGLDDAYLMVSLLKQLNDAPRLAVVSGRDETESWDEVQTNKLHPMIKQFRIVFSSEIDKRFHITTTPSKHVLLALKMNPSIDTSREGPLFKNKPAAHALMEAEYKQKLRTRSLHIQRHGIAAKKSLGRVQCAPNSPSVRPDINNRPCPDSSSSSCASSSKRSKISLLAYSTFNRPTSTPTDVVQDVEVENEIKLFAQAGDLSKFEDEQKRFDKSAFWNEKRDTLPIHYNVYLADCASKKAASANVETVFCGAKKLSDNAPSMGDDLLGAYVSNHVNWQYEWLRPHVHDIVCNYLRVHGNEGLEDMCDEDEEQ